MSESLSRSQAQAPHGWRVLLNHLEKRYRCPDFVTAGAWSPGSPNSPTTSITTPGWR
ncbi:hypothetical protein ACMYYO_13045 [Dermacoccaceae bacterium W4C1]